MADIHLLQLKTLKSWYDEERKRPASLKARKVHAGKYKGQLMAAIRKEFNRTQLGEVRYKNDAAFAEGMHILYPDVSDASIKNACTRWRKELKSSR
jgi:hypothetical protein